MGELTEGCGCESEPHTCESDADRRIAALEAEVGTLRSRLVDVERDRDQRLAALHRGEQRAGELFDGALGELDAARQAHADAAEVLVQVAAERDRLEERRDVLLALVADISQSAPLPSELEGWEAQRAALVAEVGTLRAALAEAERALQASAALSYEHGKARGAAEAQLSALAARFTGRPLMFDELCAMRLADEVAVLVRRRVIDARSPAADALLDFRDPPDTPRADRMAELERAAAAMVARVTRLTLEPGLPDHVWSELCRIDSELRVLLKDTRPREPNREPQP